jgi:hypothetical protein
MWVMKMLNSLLNISYYRYEYGAFCNSEWQSVLKEAKRFKMQFYLPMIKLVWFMRKLFKDSYLRKYRAENIVT